MKRFLSLLLSIVMLCSCALPGALAQSLGGAPSDAGGVIPAAIDPSTVDLSDALHFIARHWHSEEDTDTSLQGDETVTSNGRYFVVAEGYIVPVKDASGSIVSYEFYFVYQSDATQEDGDPIPAGYLMKITEADDGFVHDSNYISDIDTVNGTITLKAYPLPNDEGEQVEEFSSFSISAGHSAVTIDNSRQEFVITYDPYVHLVKAHVFYMRVADGNGDASVFGEGIDQTPEQDTAWYYTYDDNVFDNNGDVLHLKGEIVRDANGKAVGEGDTLPAGVSASLTKIYNTGEGIHTDKTASLNRELFLVPQKDADGNEVKDADGNTVMDPDGRTFNIDLEAWYAEGYAPQVAMVLDASGSMAFASDTPTEIHLSAADILAIETATNSTITKLPSGGNSPSTAEWENTYFLTDEQLSYILNPHNTDNGMLSVSGYSYFVANRENSGNINFNPLGYWEGVPTSGTPYAFKDSGDDVSTGWPDAHNDLNFSSGNGLNINTASGVKTSTTGILLDAKPAGDSFTVSFMIKKSGSPAADNSNIAPFLFIGPLSGNTSAGDFFNVYRDSGGSSNYLNVNQQMRGGGNIANLADVFGDGNNYRITLVFENAAQPGGTVTAYLSGTNGAGISNTSTGSLRTPVDAFNIIINGFKSDYSGGNFYVDDVYVIDAALDQNTVGSQLHRTDPNYTGNGLIGEYLFNNGSGNYPSGSGGRDWLWNSATPETAKVYAKKLESAVYARVSSDAPGVARTQTGKVLGSINRESGDVTVKIARSHTQAGWYYISHAGKMANHYEAINTGKRLLGVGENIQFKDTTVTITGSAPSADTNFTYKASADFPIRFYVDAKGYLRCFYGGNYNNNNGDLLSSYVYELTDMQYIRTEALRRALGVFVTELDEKSPLSRVSATRFSTSDLVSNPNDLSKDTLYKLVLLDWTSDPAVSIAALSVEYGTGSLKGAATGFTTSTRNGYSLDQYNYGLTGSTTTELGIQAYVNYLQAHDEDPYKDDSNADVPKFLILFTDGANTGTASTSKTLIDNLKNKGYTIFTVLLDGSSMGQEDYDKAKEFLTTLAGKTAYQNGETADNYFFSVNKAKSKYMDNLATEMYGDEDHPRTYESLTGAEKAAVDAEFARRNVNDADLLTQVFVDEILAVIAKPLDAYTVRDTIDPRFDLVDANGTVWHLNADGKVVKGDGSAQKAPSAQVSGAKSGDEKDEFKDLPDGEYDLANPANADKIRIRLDDKSDDDASTPYLRYDQTAGLYYLEWMNQTIPVSAVGANRLFVWNARITVRAKDDFIGGNAVLANGNGEKMNYIYHPGDGNASSGTDDADHIYDSSGDADYPSKGFPRVAVNVAVSDVHLVRQQTIYMGEELGDKDIALRLINAAVEDSYEDGDVYARYYWEYLTRYVHAGLSETVGSDTPLAELLQIIVSDDEGRTIPYMYLPNVEGTNQTGADEHRADVLGTLTYKAESVNWTDKTDIDYQTLQKYIGAEWDETIVYPNSGIAEDLIPRVTKLTVTYDPLPPAEKSGASASDPAAAANDDGEGAGDNAGGTAPSIPASRKEANDKLVTEKDTGGNGVYLWDDDYKSVEPFEKDGKVVDVGEVLDEQDPIRGFYVTHIVGGRIAVRLRLTQENLDYLQAAGITGTLSATAALYRTYNGPAAISVSNEKVATYTLVFDIPASVPAGNTYAVVTARTTDIAFEDKYVYCYRPASIKVPSEALPIGTYTLTPQPSDDPDVYWFTGSWSVNVDASHYELFTELFGRQDGEYTGVLGINDKTDPNRWTRIPGRITGYSAWYGNGNSPMLGTGAGKTVGSDTRAYTDERYALLEIGIEHPQEPPLPEVPKTGDDSHIELWLTLMLLSAAALCVSAAARRRATGRR